MEMDVELEEKKEGISILKGIKSENVQAWRWVQNK
jgi:hypothetical protein